MTWMRHPFKKALARLIAALALAAPAFAAQAEGFQVSRGINFDQWTTWPQRADWGDAAKVIPFPEWRRTMTDADLGRLKAAGLDFVRMPVDPRILLAPEAEGLRASLMGEVRKAVRLVTGSGLKVIVDLHAIPDGSDIGAVELASDPAVFERYLSLVADMATLIADEPAYHVALGLFNEPVIACDEPGKWAPLLKRLHETARSAAPVSVVKKGLPVPPPRMITRPLASCASAAWRE